MLRWIGKEKGAWGLPNIPARDMSYDELKERGLDKKALIETGLYIEEKPKKKKPKLEVKDNGRSKETPQDTARS